MARTLPRNAELADQLDLLADISEILGEESFRVIAYRRAATRIRETPSPVAELALAGAHRALARDEDVPTEVPLARDVVVVAVHRLDIRDKRLVDDSA